MTCVSWPYAATFAVGSFDVLRLCDKLGWCHRATARRRGPSSTWPGRPTACIRLRRGQRGGAFASVVEKRVESLKFEATQTEPNTICVYELKNEQTDQIDRDRIVDWTIGFGHLVPPPPTSAPSTPPPT